MIGGGEGEELAHKSAERANVRTGQICEQLMCV